LTGSVGTKGVTMGDVKYKIVYETQSPDKTYMVNSCLMKVRLPLNTKQRIEEAEAHLSTQHGGQRVEIVDLKIVEYDKAQTQK